MDARLLTENGWKATAQRSRVRDNGLQRALSAYERLADEKRTERLEALTSVGKLAGNLKKVREVAALPDVTEYLADVVKAAELERKQVAAAAQASQGAPDLTRLKTLTVAGKALAKNIKAGHEQIGAAQKGGASPCAREWDVATPLALKLLRSLIVLEAGIATGTVAAAIPKILSYALTTYDLFMQWGVAADELILCLRRSNAPEPEIVRFRTMRRQADALTMQLNREMAELRRRR